ncbi:MAG: DUF2855 family protein [Parvularculales bacterium]
MHYKSQNFVFNPDDFRDTKFIEGAAFDSGQLGDGEVIIEVDILALTANTITYGIAGKLGIIRYLESFPTEAPYARMPFWGFGNIVASAHADLPVGERLYGFYPLSTYLLTTMDKVTAAKCNDVTPCRKTIPTLYREYARVTAEPDYDPGFDEMQSLLRPVISTSFLLEHYIRRHDFYDARNIVITSASSKTAFGFGHFLVNQHDDKCRAIGLTSARNKAFVEKTGCYHQVLTYDEVNKLPKEASVLFDMAGNAELRASIHHHLDDLIAYSGTVGATHWDAGGQDASDLPGPRPVFWSGPDEVAFLARRSDDPQQLLSTISGHTASLMREAANWLKINRFASADEIKKAYLDMLDSKMAAEDATIFKVKGAL